MLGEATMRACCCLSAWLLRVLLVPGLICLPALSMGAADGADGLRGRGGALGCVLCVENRCVW